MATFRIQVQAANGWQFSGVQRHAGEKITISAQGLWTANPATGLVSADGNHNYSTSGRANYAYNGGGGFEGQLIAKIGPSGAPFVVGTAHQIPVAEPASGDIYFVINDDLYSQSGQGLADNQGTQIVIIQE